MDPDLNNDSNNKMERSYALDGVFDGQDDNLMVYN